MKTKTERRENEKEKPLIEARRFFSRLDKEIEKRISFYIKEIDKTYQN